MLSRAIKTTWRPIIWLLLLRTSLSRTLSRQETNNLNCHMGIISYRNTFIRGEVPAYFSLELFPCDANELKKVLWYWDQNIFMWDCNCITSSLQQNCTETIPWGQDRVLRPHTRGQRKGVLKKLAVLHQMSSWEWQICGWERKSLPSGQEKKGVKYDCFQQKKPCNYVLYLHLYRKRKIRLMIHRHCIHKTKEYEEE